VSQVGGSGKAHFLVKRILEEGGANPNLRVFAFVKDEELQSFYEDLKAIMNYELRVTNKSHIPILLFPADDAQVRAQTADKIKNLKNFIVCASDASMLLPVAAPSQQNSITVAENLNLKFEDFVIALSGIGYERVNFVEDRLQFAVRGDIVDVWPAAAENPVRISFEFDRVETIKNFDQGTQLSSGMIEEIKILSAKQPEAGATIKDYFNLQGQPLTPTLSRKGRGSESVIASEARQSSDVALLFFDYPIPDEEKEFLNFDLLINDPLNPKSIVQDYKGFVGFQGDVSFFVNSLKSFAEGDVNIKIFCANSGEQERISDIFDNAGWDYKTPEFLYGNLSQGFYLKKENLAILSSREMLYKKKPLSFPKISGGRRLEGIWEIANGDFVVHEKYGIGRYTGLKTLVRDDKTAEYLCIEYAKSDKLYVPPEEIKTVKKYIGVEGARPKLYSMDSMSWERIKSRAREAAAAFAKELLALYAQRSQIKRAPYSGETPWEKELADAFPYEETPDQHKAIEDVSADFLKSYPMERLVCGDVGYGKTEVAVRAAFKVVQNGAQAAVLVPTTVLAQQHYNTFYNRLSIFPTKVAVISRFQTKARQKEILKDLKDGKIDIIVGTHRLLQSDVEFKNIGILIIDEEHRFGVKQKEKIKALKKNIDILMLSATPIPRTLSSALSGFRDLSVIETPPFGRLPIETSLSLYDENLVKKIIEAELSRGGQVFYVYNKVETILNKADEIRKLVPDIKLGVIHGQMRAKDIEDIMWKFTNMELDALLATTIIESGLDIPSVNTMIVEEAENFGLSQLYQLRGRIGRERKKAYCYLFYKDENLSGEAVKRLEAMKEFSELGSGFRLALKDLEIRGAGGILSASQHGFVRDIGYDMFSKLLEQEGKKIKGLQGQDAREDRLCEIDLRVSAYIPQEYIPEDDIRILFYRKLSSAKDAAAIESVKAELLDRFGKIPAETQMLFEISVLRIEAEKLNIERISEDDTYIYVFFAKEADFSTADLGQFIKNHSKIIEFLSGKSYGFKLKKSKIQEEALPFIKSFLDTIGLYFK